MKFYLNIFLVTINCLFCASTVSAGEKASYLRDLILSVDSNKKGAEALLDPWIKNDISDGQHNRVLNEMEAGYVAFIAGYYEYAEVLLSDAQKQIETIYANSPSAEAARSKFVPEASKDFKGDPYERAMVGYYLGIIDLIKGDYDNARAGFRFAQLQDTMSASEKYQDDMALMKYMVGWSYWCEGNHQSAKEEFIQAQNIRSDLKSPRENDDLIMIAELGNAPYKFASGEYGELLKYKPGAPVTSRYVQFYKNNEQIPSYLGEDLYYQASTRGGAAVDAIRGGKASFKQGAETIANAAGGIAGATLGASLISDGDATKDLLIVGVVASAVSAVSSGVANSTQTKADTRFWSSLPAQIYIATNISNASEKIEAGLFDEEGQFIQSQVIRKPKVNSGQCAIAYTRGKSNLEKSVSLDSSKWKSLPVVGIKKKSSDIRNNYVQNQPEISKEGSDMLDAIKGLRDSAK